MSVDPFAREAPGFDDPLGVLQACHRRIEKQLATLIRLLRHLPVHHADRDARAAAGAILRYFDSAAVNHHADEEESLFPRLRTRGGDIARAISILEAEHVALATRWSKLRPRLAAIAGGRGAYLPAAAVHDLCEMYATHIAREDGEVFPAAERLLDAPMLALIGGEMAARRNLSTPASVAQAAG